MKIREKTKEILKKEDEACLGHTNEQLILLTLIDIRNILLDLKQSNDKK